MGLFPFQWFWQADDGRVYSSAARSLVSGDDPGFVDFKASGRKPTRWPADDAGAQTDAALNEVLGAYGLTVHATPLAAMKADQSAKLYEACAAAIVAGFTSDALGTAHDYPSTQVDQINLSGSVMASLLPGNASNWTTAFWCRDEAGAWGFRAHSAAEIQQVGRDGKAHVLACQTKLGALNQQIAAATTAEAVSAATWD
ncbi:hypothetical protein [Azorhizobium caulinodans]